MITVRKQEKKRKEHLDSDTKLHILFNASLSQVKEGAPKSLKTYPDQVLEEGADEEVDDGHS
jgi:hypothetical protein